MTKFLESMKQVLIVLDMGVYFSESHIMGGGGKLRIQMGKVKDLVNNASI